MWRTDWDAGARLVDVIPIGDTVDHEWGDGCPCGPGVELIDCSAEDLPDAWMWVHHSLDNREAVECG